MTIRDAAFRFEKQAALRPGQLSNLRDVFLKPAQKKGSRIDPSGDQPAKLSSQSREAFEQNQITAFRDSPGKRIQRFSARSRLTVNPESRESGELREVLQQSE